MSKKVIAVNDAKKLLDAGNAVLVDVREVDEYKSEHIDGAINTPLSSLNVAQLNDLSGGKTLIIQCLSGKRATAACEQINKDDALVLEGGIEGWKKSGLATTK